MADKPICIITPEGMKCLSSPLKKHFPGKRDCVLAVTPTLVQKAADDACREMGKALDKVKRTKTARGKTHIVHVVSPAEYKQIQRLVRLAIESQFDLTKPFTIVKA